jgi:hypothetical protein
MNPRRLLSVVGGVVAAFSAAATPWRTAAGRDEPPAKSLGRLDEEFAASAKDLVRRSEAEGFAKLAELVGRWQLPEETDRQFAFAIPARAVPPGWIEKDVGTAIWNDFIAARRARAAGIFEHAIAASREHDRVPTRDELAKPDPDKPPLAQASCEVVRLLARVLRDDPDHERAREALGWAKRGDSWAWPEAARRLDKGEEFDAAFGWLPKGRLARYRSGERYDRGRWLTAEADAARTLAVDRGRRFDSDHWEILSPAPLSSAAALAQRLETTFIVWRQVFGAFGLEPADLEKRLKGRGRIVPHDPFAAVLCIDRRQYVTELAKLEPSIGRTNGLYWPPTKTAWYFDESADKAAEGDESADKAAKVDEPTDKAAEGIPPAAADSSGGLEAFTVHHEATHQLFAEIHPTMRKVAALAGERCGFWAIEAAACYMESIAAADFGWTVGGRDAGRVPAARERLVEDEFHVPLEELAAMGRKAFQSDARLPQIYSEIAGLADFFMNGQRGRYREAFVEYLSRVYAGTADPETLSRLCRRTYAGLDADYRRHLSQ